MEIDQRIQQQLSLENKCVGEKMVILSDRSSLFVFLSS